MQLDDYIGRKGSDTITGFGGVVTGYCVYISGCHQICLQPPVNDKGEIPDGKWFDVQRIVLAESPQLRLVNENSGFDAPPPVR
jgi:hypothetical protein